MPAALLSRAKVLGGVQQIAVGFNTFGGSINGGTPKWMVYNGKSY